MAARSTKRRATPNRGSAARGRASAGSKSGVAPWFVGAVLIAGAGFVAWRLLAPPGTVETVTVAVPVLSSEAQAGARSYEANCAQCHGVHAAGSDRGPPLVHAVYNAGHHADIAFVLAARLGARQHHWSFGDMPPQPQLKDGEITAIIRYVRELQEANGIETKPHTM
ncbi:MAG: cytochrome c [Alphaproteobacteria bacterium]